MNRFHRGRPGRRKIVPMPTGAGRVAERVLRHRRLPLAAALLGVALCLPALTIGWQLDDHFQRLVLLGEGPPGVGPFQLFSVLDPNLPLEEYLDFGVLPWWTAEGYRLAFFRFLSLATSWLDYRLWPDSAPLMHLHSLLWYGAVVLAAGLLYRRLSGSGAAAGLAALLYAIDEAHGTPAAWLANRNALPAALFGILAILAHDRWRRSRERRAALWSALCLALALASGEAALGAVAYLVAHALTLEPGRGWRVRLAALSPAAAVIALWSALYLAGGFGARGSGLYVDPLASPLRFGAAVIERAPFFLLGQWTPLAADLGALLPPANARFFWWASLAVMATLTAAFTPLLRRLLVARFYALGMLLALLPICATFASNRLLLFVGLGAMGLLALFLEQLLVGTAQTAAGWRRIAVQIVAILLVLSHLVLAPILLPLGVVGIKSLGEPMVIAAASLPPEVGDRELVIVNAPDYLLYVSNLPTLRRLQGQAIPRRIRALSAAPVDLELSRLDERTVRIRFPTGSLFSGTLGRLFRSPDQPLPPGFETELDGFRARVVAVDDAGDPIEIEYRFATPLEDPDRLWVVLRDGRWSGFPRPAAGETVLVPAARDLLSGLGQAGGP